MPWANTSRSYGSVAKFLHWSIALLFLLEYCLIYYRHWFTVEGAPDNPTVLHLHQSFGISVLAFVIVRLVSRLGNAPPDPLSASKWTRAAAGTGHAILYFSMIAMPVSGYFYAEAPTSLAGLYTLPSFRATALAHWLLTTLHLTLKDDFIAPLKFLHREIASARFLWMLIVIHSAAALYHHYVKHDATLTRMLPTWMQRPTRVRGMTEHA